jgi:ADP-heptose:LPS heptosyltransferase
VIRPRSVRPHRVRRLLWRLRDVLFLAADSVVIAWGRFTAARPSAQERSKLAVVAAHGLGDLILLRGVFDELLRLYPPARWHITLICSTVAREFAERDLAVDAIIDVDRIDMRRDLPRRLLVIGRLARAGFAAAIQPNYNREILIEDALIRATKAADRIGSEGTPQFISRRERTIGDRWYTQLVPVAERPMHDLERNAEFFRSLGVALKDVPRPRLTRPLQRPAAAERPYLLFAVGASSPLKTWPLREFVWLARTLAERGLPRAMFCSGPTDWIDRAALDGLKAAGFDDLLGRTSVADLTALISRARLVISNDSATVHLAAALTVPAIAIAGGGIIGRYLPYPADEKASPADPVAVMMDESMDCFGCGWRCKFDVRPGAPAPCVERVQRERVLAAVIAQFDQSAASFGREPPAVSKLS